ncbi:ABC transporter substrate-binding protein [Aminobacter aminovorans]|uniref:Branched-chain amino acid ABC transporter substrate-binding protein n=1 Tax=Aminobacter aminovorans TaxID=83263 RepID=A0AAC8YVY9_AMIAI|nr:ABC transporter substrate-binding protein [Aminobacter aminovorans]AMS45492.1 Branched-chain amino acid ABC transporter substrate-binding protein [Aminobacter aminovorans]MBB3708700.1 branched-chain amino acid transport system substrate-binding protein [Aminobacter aminovorans]
MKKIAVVLAATISACPIVAHADIKVGVTISASGPAASLGIPERNAIALAPKEMNGEPVSYIVLDDASDPTIARRNIERLVTQDGVDIVIGSSTSPASLAMVEVAGQTKTPMISLGASRAIIFPMNENKKWAFKTPFNDATQAGATVKDMLARGYKTVATFAFNDAYGEGWVQEFKPLAEAAGLKFVAEEKFNPKDTSVTAQALKVVAARPDAVLIVASGTPGALPQIALTQRGYQGQVYQTTGVVNGEFLKIGGKAVEGLLIAGNPISVASELPQEHPAQAEAAKFAKAYNERHGGGSVSAFAGYAQDALLLLEGALPKAMESARPGTPEFRAALRDAIEKSDGVQTTSGPVTMSPEDHNGYTSDAPIMIRVKNGAFSIAQ